MRELSRNEELNRLWSLWVSYLKRRTKVFQNDIFQCPSIVKNSQAKYSKSDNFNTLVLLNFAFFLCTESSSFGTNVKHELSSAAFIVAS